MGYIVYRASRQQAIHDELANVRARSSVLAHRAIGNRLWFLAQTHTGENAGRKWIGLTLIDIKSGEAAIKCMDETVGPYYYDCPLSFLDQADPPFGPYARPWREAVRAFHAERAARQAVLRQGARVVYDDTVYVLRLCLGRRGWQVHRESDGLIVRMKARQLSQAKVLPANESLDRAGFLAPLAPAASEASHEHV